MPIATPVYMFDPRHPRMSDLQARYVAYIIEHPGARFAAIKQACHANGDTLLVKRALSSLEAFGVITATRTRQQTRYYYRPHEEQLT